MFTEYILSIQGPTNIEASTCQNPMWSMRYMKSNRNKGMQAFAVTLSQSQNVSGSFWGQWFSTVFTHWNPLGTLKYQCLDLRPQSFWIRLRWTVCSTVSRSSPGASFAWPELTHCCRLTQPLLAPLQWHPVYICLTFPHLLLLSPSHLSPDSKILEVRYQIIFPLYFPRVPMTRVYIKGVLYCDL